MTTSTPPASQLGAVKPAVAHAINKFFCQQFASVVERDGIAASPVVKEIKEDPVSESLPN
jgi:hypothetical protein